MKNKMTKNYLILAVIFIVGIGITLYLCDCYRVYDEYQKQTPVIRGTLSEITNRTLSFRKSNNYYLHVYIKR